ncbi:hypothetical protein BV25DRAFT_1828601 [Artomyces pyxidatus]|uniref:Uncharacterized protein n=1 Tax=Artomyces pyxidatus TaxID=48021 RepID=A0ACB8STR4_9AGAM|nr:hypothetical protein BV25DRAFT_1828601 [Artomyces pyxidatus]
MHRVRSVLVITYWSGTYLLSQWGCADGRPAILKALPLTVRIQRRLEWVLEGGCFTFRMSWAYKRISVLGMQHIPSGISEKHRQRRRAWDAGGSTTT